jgi:hypothetical protein
MENFRYIFFKIKPIYFPWTLITSIMELKYISTQNHQYFTRKKCLKNKRKSSMNVWWINPHPEYKGWVFWTDIQKKNLRQKREELMVVVPPASLLRVYINRYIECVHLSYLHQPTISGYIVALSCKYTVLIFLSSFLGGSISVKTHRTGFFLISLKKKKKKNSSDCAFCHTLSRSIKTRQSSFCF